MVEVPDYSFISKDAGPSLSGSINNWLTIDKNVYDLKEKGANEAIGNILQQSTDAQGNVDYGTANALAAKAGPRVQMGMQTMLQANSARRGEQITQGGAMYNNVARAAMSVATDPSDENLAAQRDALKRMYPGQGQLLDTEFDAAKAMQPADRVAWARNHGIGALDASDRMAQTFGGTFRQTGPTGATTGGWQAPPWQGGGVAAPAGQPGAPQGLDPGQAAARQQWLQTGKDYPDPANPTVTKHGTNETYLRDTGVPDQYIYTGGAPASPGTQPGAASPLGTGRLPPALRGPNQPAPAAAPAAAPSPAGTGISGPTPAQKAGAAATEETGRLSPPKFQAESDADALAQNQQAILGNMLVDTSQFTTGPLAGIVGKVRNLAGNFGLNINTDAQSAKESFGKLAAGIAVSQAQAVGAGSDTRFNVVSAANPHEELSPAGVDLILRQLQGNTDYIRARASLAAKYPEKANYPAFQESIKELDPRVFQLSRMTGDQRTTYWNNLKDTDQKQLGAAIKKAKDMGVLGGG